MAWDYTKLKIEIVKRKMSQTEFRERVGFSSTVLAKINRGEKIDMDILWKICKFLNCDIGDVVTFVEVNTWII